MDDFKTFKDINYYDKKSEPYFESLKLNNPELSSKEDTKKKKFTLFKTNDKLKELENDLKINTEVNNLMGVGSLVRNTLNNNNTNNNKLKKSISFTKPLVNEDSSSSDDHKSVKESTPLFNPNTGLLTTVANTSSVSSLNETSTPSNSLAQTGPKMVTFGSNAANSSSIKRQTKANNSMSTLNTTVTTGATGSTSSNTATTSPSASSSNNEDIDYTNLTVRDQSLAQTKIAPVDVLAGGFRTPRYFVNSKLPPLPKQAKKQPSSFDMASDRTSESIDGRYMNKMCEEIEVSLNVDCECADDYSSNDFSGDYSFDAEMKSPVLRNVEKYGRGKAQAPALNTNSLVELRKNFEHNIARQLRGVAASSSSSATSNYGGTKVGQSGSAESQSSPSKNHLGVLV